MLSGNNLTFRQCKFYFNATGAPAASWFLSAPGDNLVFDQIEVGANESASGTIDYFLYGLAAPRGTNFTLTNSLIRNVRVGIARDRAGIPFTYSNYPSVFLINTPSAEP
jgi:hypothetical protein